MHPNLENIARVHVHLRDLGLDVVYVGGATIGLYLDTFGASKARPTKDVDCIVPIEARSEYAAFESSRTLEKSVHGLFQPRSAEVNSASLPESFGFFKASVIPPGRPGPGRLLFQQPARLRDAGLFPSADEGDPLCRWNIGGIKVDIMPLDEGILGFTNRFYRLGYDTAQTIELPSGHKVKVLSPALLLATKIDAFLDRGARDPAASEDLEDIIAVVDGCVGIAEHVAGAPPPVRAAIKVWASEFLARKDAYDLVEGHIAAWGDQRGVHVLQLLERLAFPQD